jgi:signal transduction histidine kinase
MTAAATEEQSPPTVSGCVARLSLAGQVLDVLVDPLGRCAGASPGTTFLDLLDDRSRHKGQLLLDHLRDDDAAFGWELRLADDEATLLRFSGVREGDGLLVLGIPVGEDVSPMLHALTGVNNAVVNRLRELEQARAAQVPAPGVDLVGGVNHLDTELLNLHRELARRTAQLEEVNEQKNALIGMAAHDLRNPIGAIRGFAQLLLARISDRLDDRELLVLERIERSSEHMLDLVNDLLELTDVDRAGLAVRLHRTECDLAALVATSVEVDRALAEPKSISIELELATEPLTASVDERKFEQVLVNLLSNAVKFSPPGSTVSVRLERCADTVVLEVTDQGPGIPEEELALVFEPFARTSVQPTGGERSTGLGLAIVERIVEGHGGRIELDTELGVGTTFRVLLPRTSGDVLPPS